MLTEVKRAVKTRYSEILSLDSFGKTLTSVMIASSVAATNASPLFCEPVTAREKRRK